MSRIFIGIDNGLTGAMVALSDHPGPAIASTVMPTRGKARGNEIDAELVWLWIESFATKKDNLTVILEIPGKHSPGAQALCSMWDSFGCLRSILETRRIRHHRIQPQAWQKAVIGPIAKGDTKPAALAKARQLWPTETFLATARSTKPHEGIVDAYLIAEYGRMKNL